MNGEYRESIPLMKRAISIDPEFALAYRSMAMSYGNIGFYKERKEFIQKAFELSARLPEREKYWIHGDFYKESEKTWGKSIEAYNHLIRLYPDAIAGYTNLSIIFARMGQWEKVLELRKTAVEKDPHALNISNLAGAYRDKGLYEEAKEVLQEYLASHPDNTSIHLGLAHTYVCQKKFAKLLEFPHPVASFLGSAGLSRVYGIQGKLKNILEINRKMIQGVMGFGQKSYEFQVRVGMSFGYLFSGDLEEAWKEIEILKNLAREEEVLGWEIMALFMEGFYYSQVGSLDKAQNAADEMEKKIDESINKYGMRFYYTLIGKIELEQKNYPEAIEHEKKAIALLPAEDDSTQLHAAFLDFLGNTFYLSGDFENAREQYEQIRQMTWGRLSTGGSYTKSFYMLGKIHERPGDKARAIEYYEKALDLWKDADPGIPEAENAKIRSKELQK